MMGNFGSWPYSNWFRRNSGTAIQVISDFFGSFGRVDRVLTRAKGRENKDWPEITLKCSIDGGDESKDTK